MTAIGCHGSASSTGPPTIAAPRRSSSTAVASQVSPAWQSASMKATRTVARTYATSVPQDASPALATGIRAPRGRTETIARQPARSVCERAAPGSDAPHYEPPPVYQPPPVPQPPGPAQGPLPSYGANGQAGDDAAARPVQWPSQPWTNGGGHANGSRGNGRQARHFRREDGSPEQ